MKIYRTVIAARNLTRDQANNLLRIDPSLSVEQLGETTKWAGNKYYKYNLRRRVEFVREWHVDGKALLRLLPAWAKHHTVKSIGAKVTAFYALNNKVVTGLHESGFVIGSDEYHDWLETQPDCFRATRQYLQNKYGHRI